MAELTSPIELLELQDGESVSFRALKHDTGLLVIRPAHRPEGKQIQAVRVYVPEEDKPLFPHYWDLTASTLVAQITPHLNRPDLPRLRFKITARGVGPKKRFSIDVGPS